MQYLRVALVVFLSYVFAGCSGGHHRLHSIEDAQPNQIVIVKGSSPVDVYWIDGKYGPNFGGAGKPKRFNSIVDGSFVIELAPGKHEFIVGFLDYGEQDIHIVTLRSEPMRLSVELQPGGVYIFDFTLHQGYKSAAEVTGLPSGSKVEIFLRRIE